jgi:poly-gamma-glutamate capsule biosynthesis protein CapA/YwtB (metallophosphatase superfamily)
MTDSPERSIPLLPRGGPARERRPLSRRAFIVGAVPVVAAATAAAGALAMQYSRSMQSPVTAVPAKVASSPGVPTATPRATPFAAATPRAEAAPRATEAPRQVARALPNIGVPQGMALVASPRLPLPGVGPQDPWRLLTGNVLNWAEVGSAVPSPVRPVGLAGEVVSGIRASESFETYDALASALARDAGAVALVPLELVDFRVQTLKVGDADPLRTGVNGQETMRIGVIGDIVPGRNVHLHMQQYGDFTRPFHRVAPLLSSFDVTVANLEGNLSDNLPQPADSHSFSFVSSPAMLDGFALAGIDAVTLANNHTVWNSENWGLQGLLDTVDALEAFGLPYFGAGRDLATARAPWVVEFAGMRVAFLGIDGVTANYEAEPGTPNGVLDFDAGATGDRPGTNPYLAWQVMEDIAAATANADVVIPYFHFGAEYVAVPPDWAVEAAHMAIDAGATMVVSNHPHVVQGTEIYDGRPIVYSPGNFILDQMWAAEVRSGYVLEIDLRGTAVVGLRYHGIEIEDFHQPRPMSPGEQAALMDRFWAASDRLAERSGEGF